MTQLRCVRSQHRPAGAADPPSSVSRFAPVRLSYCVFYYGSDFCITPGPPPPPPTPPPLKPGCGGTFVARVVLAVVLVSFAQAPNKTVTAITAQRTRAVFMLHYPTAL